MKAVAIRKPQLTSDVLISVDGENSVRRFSRANECGSMSCFASEYARRPAPDIDVLTAAMSTNVPLTPMTTRSTSTSVSGSGPLNASVMPTSGARIHSVPRSVAQPFGPAGSRKDYRLEGPDRYKTMTLATNEFIRRFLIHVLPKGLHRIRHYGLFAKAACADNIDRARQLLGSQKSQRQAADTDHHDGNQTPLSRPCPCCGGRMLIIEVFERGATPRHRPSSPIIAVRIDTS